MYICLYNKNISFISSSLNETEYTPFFFVMENKTWRKKAEIEILFVVVPCNTETYECACSSFFKVRSLMKILNASFFLFHKMYRFDRFRRPYH